MRNIILVALVLTQVSCGGGGESQPQPRITITGPSEVWSDDSTWTARANVSNIDLGSVVFTITGEGDVAIDPATGIISSLNTGSGIDPGLNRFVITAVDSAGATASTTWDLKSNLNLAGSWFYRDPEVPEHVEYIYISRQGVIHNSIYTDEGFQGSCHGNIRITGSDFSANSDCMFVEESENLLGSLSFEGQADENSLVIKTVEGKSGDFLGDTNDMELAFVPIANGLNAINIRPGIYHSTIAGFLKVTENGIFEDLPFDQLPYELAECEISGSIQEDPVYGLSAQADSLFPSVGAFDGKISLSGCETPETAIINQEDTSTVVVSSIESWGGEELVTVLRFLMPVNWTATGDYTYDHANIGLIYVCDELNNPALSDESGAVFLMGLPIAGVCSSLYELSI